MIKSAEITGVTYYKLQIKSSIGIITTVCAVMARGKGLQAYGTKKEKEAAVEKEIFACFKNICGNVCYSCRRF